MEVPAVNNDVNPEKSAKRRKNTEIVNSTDTLESKKPKRSVQQEIALEELANCDSILNQTSLSVEKKMITLTTFLDSIIKHNINILLLKEDFNEWVKSATINIVSEVTVASEELYLYLQSVLRTAPVIFESICDKVLPLIIFLPKCGKNVNDSYNEFMKLLVLTFEKLRRFPKLIAKLLYCVREYHQNSRSSQKTVHKKVKTELETSNMILTTGFMESIGPVISLLPFGQIMDLWKTLHHNFAEECVKKVATDLDDELLRFFTIVTDIFLEFLSNIKLADHTVPENTLDKACECLTNLRDECLGPLGVQILQKKHDSRLVQPFLRLCFTWAELNGLLTFYNAKYRKFSPVPALEQDFSATNLTYLHPYLKADDWSKLFKRSEKDFDTSSQVLMVSLVAQKLKYMAALNQLDGTGVSCDKSLENSNNALLSDHINSAVDFIWRKHANMADLSAESMEICSLSSQYMNFEDIIQLGCDFIKKIAMRQEDSDGTYYNLIDSTSNHHFHCGLVLESIGEILTRLWKMKIFEKETKVLVTEILSKENRAVILQASSYNSIDLIDEGKPRKIILRLLDAVNSILEDSVSEKKSKGKKAHVVEDGDFSNDLICDMVKYLSELPLEDYHTLTKTVMFLCSLYVLIGVAKKADKNLIEKVAYIFCKSGSNSHGNVTLFAIKWTTLFKWFCTNIEFLSEKMQAEICNVILCNIYISPKPVADFEDEFNLVCESEMTASIVHIRLLLLEFLTTELQLGRRTKVTPQLQAHTRKLTHIVVKSIEDSTNAGDHNSYRNVYLDETHLYRGLWLSQMSLKALSTCKIDEDEKDYSLFKSMLTSRILSAISLMTSPANTNNVNRVKVEERDAIKFLHGVCKSREEFKDNIPDDFIVQLWNICLKYEPSCQLDRAEDESQSIIPIHFLKDMYEAANANEFSSISESIMTEMANFTSSNDPKEDSLITMIRVLDEFIDAELVADKKQTRWKTLESCLHGFLVCSVNWTPTKSCLLRVVLPYTKFQLKLLRRRRPMGSLISIATCLTSVTMTPINQIQDTQLYKKVFCQLADIMIAFAKHRLDVISFRTHIYLQCFQFLVESIVSKSDQKRNLSDDEIFLMRHCGHYIERICQSVKGGEKEFARTSPYFVAVMIRQFEQFTVYPTVKHPLLSGCYKLLDLCDEHAVAQLNSMLSTGSREVFKPIYDMYQKFYRYRGRT